MKMKMALPQQIRITCLRVGCNGVAIARQGMIWKGPGIQDFHFDCAEGHAYHTDALMKVYMPCDCKHEEMAPPRP